MAYNQVEDGNNIVNNMSIIEMKCNWLKVSCSSCDKHSSFYVAVVSLACVSLQLNYYE